MKNTIKKSLKVKLRVVFRCLHLKEFISLLAILMSLLTYGQSEMTAKEGFYYLYKVSNEKITDDAIKNLNNTNLNMNWFFLYANTFDKTNFDNARNNEFKWPEYSKRIQHEISQGKKNADFNKLFSYSSIAEFGKYNSQYGGFPISNGWKRIFSDKQFFNYPINIYVGKYWMNKAYLDNFLKMDPKKGEELVERHPGERRIEIKVIYNVVNKYMKNENEWDKKYLGIYVHKVIYLDGSNILGEIIPDKNHKDIEKTRILNIVRPNIEVIKRDLLGNKLWIEGDNPLSTFVWSFDSLEEFQKATILDFNLKQGQMKTFYLNLNVDMELKDYTSGKSYKINVDVIYRLINYKWVFDSVKGNSWKKL